MPADQVGAQDQVAEHEVVGDELAHPLGWDDEHLAVLDRFGGEERHLAFQQSELAQESARTVQAQYPAFAVLGALVDDRDLAGEDDEEVAAAGARSDQHLAGVNRSTCASGLERRDLVVRQPRECSDCIRGLVVDELTVAQA